MDESDDDFNELCSKLLRRVRKKGAKKGTGKTETQKEDSSIQTKSKLKRTKLPTKTKISHDSTEKKTELSQRGLAPGNEEKCEVTSHESRAALTSEREEDTQKDLVSQPSQPKNRTVGVPDDSSQTTSNSFTALLPSVSKPRAADLVLQKMQQFKRIDPEKLKHAPEGRSVGTVLKDSVPESGLEEDALNNGNMPGLSVTESDAALALALQQEFGQETSQNSDSLEQEGLFFCQICQKDLSAMNATRREQHVNRCLDESENASSAPKIPECPICGKPFTTSKSRNSHLKQCAVKMEVSPQQLVQAVRLQTSQANECFPSASSKLAGESKRKGSTNEKKPQKRRKITKTEAMSEDLLVAMAMSHSLMEQSKPNDNLGNMFPNNMRTGAEKKSRKRKLVSPPQLLIQDSETYLQQIQDRIAVLLTEELELSSTPPLPLSKILKEEMGKAHWCLLQPEEKQGILWKGSSLTGAWPLESFYAKGLDPPVLPWKPMKNSEKGPMLPLMAFSQSKPDVQELPAFSRPTSEGFNFKTPEEPNSRRQSLSSSQKDHQTLQVLMDLAGEGLTLTQWNSSAETYSRSPLGKDLESCDLPLTGFVLSPKEKKHQRSGSSALSLSLLSADFGAMVNNPHLSDVQFQMDSGDVLYAHMFVLYARCPCLIQIVHSEGFFVVEDENVRTRRVLLNEVSTETAHMFLQYLYTAETNIPSHLLSDLQSLAIRFGVKELADLCESGLEATDINSEDDMFLVGKEEEDCESRAENFQELLRSMWVDEDKESELLLKLEDQDDDREEVNEEDLEEIYEFAATQRKTLQEKCQTKEVSMAGQPREGIPVLECLPLGVRLKKQMDDAYEINSSEQVKGQEPSVSNNVDIKHCAPVPGQEKIPDNEAGTESPEKDPSPKSAKAVTHSSTSDLLVEVKGDSLREKLTSLDSLHDFDLDKSCDQLFSVTQGEYCESSQINCNPKKQKGAFPGREVSSSPILCQTPPLQPDFSPSRSHCQSPSNSQIFPQCRHDSSPLSPQLKRKISKIASPPILIEEQKENNDIYTLNEDSPCKDRSECGYIASHKNTAALISPVKPPSIDLTQPKSCQRPFQSNIRSQNSLSQVNKDDDIILLLDSDEEVELEQTKMKTVSVTPCGERKTPRALVGKGEEVKNSPKPSQPFLIIDIDSDQRYSQSPIATEVGVHRDMGMDVLIDMQSHRKRNSCLDDEPDFRLISTHDNSKEESSSTDTSWLVPATPLTKKSHDYSSQMRVTSIISRSCVSSLQDKVLQCKTKPIENKDANEITNKVSINVPQTSSPLVPITSEIESLSETSVSERYSHRSPAIQYSKVNKNLSTIVPVPFSPERAAVIKQSLESPSTHAILSSAHDKPVLIQNVCSEVVEVVDSEEEQDLDPCPLSSSLLLNSDPPIPVDDDYWNIEPLSPIPIDNVNLERTGHLSTSSPNNKVCETLDNSERNSPGTLSRMGSTPVHGSPIDKRSLHCNKKRSLCTSSPGNSNLSYLNSALWDDWDGEQKSTEILPLAKRLSDEVTQELEVLKTPKAADRKTNRPPKVPITPMPSYSIMETPELKKELNRFGVRPLPKRQMVLKLKEIFQYTHQILPSDSEEEIQALQTFPRAMVEPCCLTQTTSPVRTSGAENELPSASSSCVQPSVEGGQSKVSDHLSSISHRKLKNLTKTQGRRKRPHKAIFTLTQPPPEDVHSGPASDNQISMSQKSFASSTDESENSFGSQSSIASEFETVFESEGEEEEELTASQAAAQDADKEEAARRYIRSNPTLYQKILLYQPFELADLQAELKQNGIKFAMGKLLDFLDAHCITFTTAGARKEKLKKKQQPGGKKRGKRY